MVNVVPVLLQNPAFAVQEPAPACDHELAGQGVQDPAVAALYVLGGQFVHTEELPEPYVPGRQLWHATETPSIKYVPDQQQTAPPV